MSRRAYRINSINVEQSESFNLSHDEILLDLLDKDINIYDNLNSDGSGIIDIPVEILNKVIKSIRLDNDLKKSLKKDIKWTKDNNKDYLQYYCF